MYSFDIKTPSPAKGFACLIAKATSDESKLWHRRLGYINFKNLNKLVKGNLVRGLPSKVFKNDHTLLPAIKANNTGPLARPNNGTEFKNRNMLEFYGEQELKATIDTDEYTISELSVRNKLKLADENGITEFTNAEIFKGMANLGSKSGGWDQFGSKLATALICLSTGRTYNFSKMI
ncbi:ribonuclease H-like domain-containing protein, partial [Tanacetum coccineum]